MGVERLTRRITEKFLPRKVCACFFAEAVVVNMFVSIVVSYAAGHGKECVTEIVRVKSIDSPLSAMAVVKTPPQAVLGGF